MTNERTSSLTLKLRTASAGHTPAGWQVEACESCDRRDEECVAVEFAQALSLSPGVRRATIDRLGSTLTLEYEPERFSSQEVQTIAERAGVILDSNVERCIFELPELSRAEDVDALERRLMGLPGVSRASANPLGRSLTIEYDRNSGLSAHDLVTRLRKWGYRAGDGELALEGWERHRLAVYTMATALGLISAWAVERAGGPAPAVAALAAAAYLAGGGFAARSGLRSLRQGRIDVDTLMVVAALGAAAIGEWIEGGVLLFLFALSNALETYAMDRTRHAIRALMDLRPSVALIRRSTGNEWVTVEDLRPGDVVIIRPGERVPADGEVIAGRSAIDQAPITGESVPVSKAAGDAVYAGTINGTGTLEARVTRRAEESTLARIIQLVEEAQSERAPTQKRLDAFERKYALVVIASSLLMIVVPPLFLGWAWPAALYRSMMLLVVASPCALVISTPASILSAIAAGARQGVLFKGGAHLESLAEAGVVALDKTGTLTAGRPVVTDIYCMGELDEAALLSLAASIEARSEHPLASAIVEAARRRGLALDDGFELQAVPGKGAVARKDGRLHLVGKPELLGEWGVVVPALADDRASAFEAEGKSIVYLGEAPGKGGGGRLLGMLAIADTIRPEAARALQALRECGVKKIVMLTGDNRRAAEAIGRQAGIDEVLYGLLPEEKVAAVRALREAHGTVVMVGDGVNDAPAMAAATLGVAMGAGGTDVALETADIVLMSSDLRGLPAALRLSRRARQVIWQNLAFALAVIVLLVCSTFLNLITLPLGVVGHEGSTIVVVLNGLRLLRQS